MEQKEIINNVLPFALRRVNSYLSNELLFSLLDAEFKPYSIDNSDALSFSFVLQFYSPI